MRALIVNNYSPLNLGDGAIVEGLVFSLRRAGYDHITIAAIYPDHDWSALGVDAVVPSLFRVPDGSRARRALGLARSMLRALVPPSEYRQADLVVSVGGGYLGAGRVLTNLLAGLNLAYGRLLGKRTLAAPMSIRPCTRPVAWIVRRTFGGTRTFARDTLSQRIFAEAGVAADVAPDLAFRAPSLEGAHRSDSSQTVGYAPRTYVRDHEVEWSDEVACRELRTLANDGWRVHLLTQCTTPSADDRPAVERVAALLPEASVLPIARSSTEARDQWAGLGVLVGGRMHAAIGAMLAGTPALAVGYEEKVAGIFGDLGLGDRVIHGADGLADAIRRIVGTAPAVMSFDWTRFDEALR